MQTVGKIALFLIICASSNLFSEDLNTRFYTVNLNRRLALPIPRNSSINRVVIADSSIFTIDSNYVLIPLKTGNSKVIVEKIAAQADTLDITVVPWIVGASTLDMQMYLPNYRLLSILNDTLYLQGAGGSANWMGFYTRSINSSSVLRKVFPYTTFNDGIRCLATPFGAFIMPTRAAIGEARKIYRMSPGTNDFQVVMSAYPADSVANTFATVLDDGWSYDKEGNVYLGEYFTEDSANADYSMKIYKATNNGTSWQVVYTFPSRRATGITGGVRHVHAVQQDPYTGDIWIGTGDNNSQARVYRNTTKLTPTSSGNAELELVGYGSQDYRVVSYAFTKDFIYWFMDSPTEVQKIYRVKRRDSYPTITPANDYRELVAVLKDKPFYYNISYKVGEDNFIIFSSVYEDAVRYGSAFKELDKRIRVFGLRESVTGKCSVQELFSDRGETITAHIDPMGIDSGNNIYFSYLDADRTAGYRVYRSKLEWRDVDVVTKVQENQKGEVVFSDNSVSFNYSSAKIDSLVLYGTPSTQTFVSENIRYQILREWDVISVGANNIENGIIKIKSSLIKGATSAHLTWLVRDSTDTRWVDLGGKQDGDYFVSQKACSAIGDVCIAETAGLTNVRPHNKKFSPLVYGNYPNPFNSETVIKFSLPEASLCRFETINSLGQVVYSKQSEQLAEGNHEFKYNARNLSSGVFFYKVRLQSCVSGEVYYITRKMIILK